MTIMQKLPYRALATGWIAGRYVRSGTTVYLTPQQARYERVAPIDAPPPPPPPPPPPVDPAGIRLVLGRSGTIRTDASLPARLATVSAEGASSVVWAVDGASGHVAIATVGAETHLMLITMPAAGVHNLIVRATSDGQEARAPYRLTVQAAAPVVVAPTTVTLSDTSETIATSAAVPMALAQLAANGTGPFAWSLVDGPSWASIDTSGAQPVLRLTAMPPIGAHPLTVRSANSAGAANATFALTVEAAAPVITAPTTVTLSATSSTVQSDAAVPVTLATLSANGTQPVTWSLVNGPSWATIDTSGAQPALRITTVPAAGDHTLTVRATNSAGSAQATYTLTVQTAQAGAPIITTRGTIVTHTTEPDGDVAFTVRDGGVDSSYVIPAATIAAGDALWLVPPVVEEQPDGTFLVTNEGMGVSPVDDPAYLTYSWEIDGVSTGQYGLTYTKADPSEDYRLIELAATLKNRVMNAAGRAAVARVVAQPAATATFSPLFMRKADNDRITFPSVSENNSNTKFVMFFRFKMTPDAGATDFKGRIGRFGPIFLETKQAALDFDVKVQMHNSAGSFVSAATCPLVRLTADAVVDMAILHGLPFNQNDLRPSTRFAFWQNGVPVEIVDGTATVTEVNRLTADAVLFKPADTMVMGGYDAYTSGVGAVSHSIDRLTMIGQIDPAKLPPSTVDLRAQFVDANNALQHPQTAISKFGPALIDFYNINGPDAAPINHGTLGAPLSMSDLK